jgi:hypothetical protein
MTSRIGCTMYMMNLTGIGYAIISIRKIKKKIYKQGGAMSDYNTLNNWTLEECRDAHMGIKSHPWRQGGSREHLKGYCRLMHDFVEATYWLTKKNGQNDLSYKVISGMQHDLAGALRDLECTNGIPRKRRNSDGSTYDDMTMAMIENCLSVMHRFLNGERIDRYWVNYTGCNNIAGVRRFHSMSWHKPDNKEGEFRPDLPLNELRLLLAHWESKEQKYYGELADKVRRQIEDTEAQGWVL